MRNLLRYFLLFVVGSAFALLTTSCKGQSNEPASIIQPTIPSLFNWSDTLEIAKLPPDQKAFFERSPADSATISMHVFRTVPFAQGSLLFAAKKINLNVTPTSSWLCDRESVAIELKTIVWRGRIPSLRTALISLYASDAPSVQGGYRMDLANVSLDRFREEYRLEYRSDWNLWYFYRYDRLKQPSANCGNTTP
jgi:hypothetical protein